MPKRAGSRGGSTKKKAKAGAGTSPRILAGTHAVGPARASSSPKQKKRKKPTSAGLAAAVGDAIQWDGQYMPAGMDTGWGKVNEAFKDHVMARPLGARKDIEIPRIAITHRAAGAAASDAPDVPARQATLSEEGLHEKSPAKPPSRPKRRRKEKQPEPAPGDGEATVEISAAALEELRQEVKRLRWAKNSQTYRDKRALKQAGEEGESDEDADPAQPLAGREVPIKVDGVLPDNYRALAVKFGVERNIPGHQVMDLVKDAIEAMGGEATATIGSETAASHLYTHCLVETDLVLELDQARRMAESHRQQIIDVAPELESCDEPDSSDDEADGEQQPELVARSPREIVDSYDDAATLRKDLEQREKDGEAAEAAYHQAVIEKLSPWIDKLDYKPERDAPNAAAHDVGPVATDKQVEERADGDFGCSFFWGACDGTTQGSNDRELLAANCGGYEGAPAAGEFWFLAENHAGQSGPRWELTEVLDRAARLRKMQRFLGYAEDELTYLYDYVAW